MSKFSDAVKFFTDKGWTPAQAQGISAGLYAESGLNENNVNSIGATGIAQWLGTRKRGMIGAGGSGDFNTQLEYVHQELTVKGLDKGAYEAGQAIKQQQTPAEVLSTFIYKFERPAAGYETTSDISRGTDILKKSGIDPGSGSGDAANTVDTSGQSTSSSGEGGIPGAILKLAGNLGSGISGTINSVETWLGRVFTITALVVLGVVFVGFGLGLFNKRSISNVVALASKIK